jgi:uncharacterized membrane protein
LIDLLAQTGASVKKIGVTHMIINLVAVVIFAVDFWLRTNGAPGAAWPITLSVIGVARLCVSGWLGGGMVYLHGVAVASPPPHPRYIITEPWVGYRFVPNE